MPTLTLTSVARNIAEATYWLARAADLSSCYNEPMLQLQDLVETTGAMLHGPTRAQQFDDFCYDSRLAAPGQLFLAVKSERRDGHAFIVDAVQHGCVGVICEQPPLTELEATVLVVPDVRVALQQWASAMLQRYQPLVIGVTGSVGKTSTKRAIATVLAGAGPTFASRRSFNSLFGLPIALGRLEPEHRFAVLEMGVDRFGEMRRLAALFPPQIAVVTNVAPTHLRYLRDEDHIAAEKAELVRALPPDGCAILNADDPRVMAMSRAETAVISFGLSRQDVTLRGEHVVVTPTGTRFDVVFDPRATAGWPSGSMEPSPARSAAFVPLLGRHSVYIALAALGVALRCGMSLESAIERLRVIERQAGRLNPLPGVNECTLLDDTYNASPASAHAALDTLAALPARRCIAVFGDMLELGEEAQRLHAAVGRHAANVADVLIAKGDLAATMAQAADAGPAEVVVTHTAADVIAAVRRRVQPGDVVLVKGSAEARMEQVVGGLLVPEVPASMVLVRQEQAFQTLRSADPGRPTWIEVDLQAVANNLRLTQALVGPQVRVLATLKADAYGHGAVRVARTLLQAGVWGFGVATVGEAGALRDAGIAGPILILGYTPAWQVRDAIRRDVRLTVFDPDVAREISSAAEELQRTAIVHVKADTGMARLGLQPADVLPLLQLLHELPGIEVEGLFTHFATADSADQRFAQVQLQRFASLLETVTHAGLRPPLVHAANSAALLRFPETHFDLVRPGLALYGLAPSSATPLPAGFRPVLSFKTEVAQVKTLLADTPVSYGGSFVTARESRIATIPVGYADGFRRSPSWKYVLLRGRRVPVVGRVAMDYTMLDVTDVPGVRAGDEVVLIGIQGDERITADEVAEWLGTINYEVVAAILPRVPRTV